MKNEYIIINKTAIQKRIEELDKKGIVNETDYISTHSKLAELRDILSQSTPLLPEIEKAFNEGSVAYCNSQDWNHPTTFEEDKQDYISNLKLDI